MKKFISMVMAAAMVVSLVPATAFAADGDVLAKSVKVVDAATGLVEDGNVTLVKDADVTPADDTEAPVVSFKIDDAEAAKDASGNIKQEVKIKLTGAKFVNTAGTPVEDLDVENDGCVDNAGFMTTWWEGLSQGTGTVTPVLKKLSNTSVTFELRGTEADWQELVKADDAVKFSIQSKMNKDNAGAEAKVSVTSDINGLEIVDKVYAAVDAKGIEVELEDDVVEVSEEETVTLEDIVLEPVVGSDFGDVAKAGEKFKLKLSKGFEFKETSTTAKVKELGWALKNETTPGFGFDENVYETTVDGFLGLPEATLTGIEIVADDAKAGDECTLTITFGKNDAVSLVVAKVVENGLTISVDEDEDVPVMWSGVNAKNAGLTTGEEEHTSLEVTVKETFEESYSDKDEIEFVLTDGVYVVDPDEDVTTDGNGFKVTDTDGVVLGQESVLEAMFAKAYNKGDYKSFLLTRNNTLPESQVNVDGKEAIEFSFELTLVADPGFVGDAELTMLVEGEEVGSVVIAKFESPMVVEAEQNDLKIDYRNTKVSSDIVVKEAEAGLWDEGLTVTFGVDDTGNEIAFEDDATYTVNEDESGMELKTRSNVFGFSVKEESDDEAAVVTISDIELYMQRNIPAGAYDLEMGYTLNGVKATSYAAQVIFGSEDTVHTDAADYYVAGTGEHEEGDNCDLVGFVGDVSDFSKVVKEAWINVVTAGREQDDASFTTKVVVPVGEAYIIAGEQTVALDVPAYVSAAGYTMLPVRAVATALGINNNNVMWDQATKTVTILYGQRIITMQVGAKVINVNGSAIPASASVEIVNGRTFLPMRDLATALGVTDITWDAATKTATLNGNI